MSLPVTASLFYKSSFTGVIATFGQLPSPTPLDVCFAVRSHLALSPPRTTEARSLLSQHSSVLGNTTTKALTTFIETVDHVLSSAAVAEEEDRDLGTQVSSLSESNEAVEEYGDHYDGEKEQVECLFATAQYLDQDPIGALETLQMGARTQKSLGSLALGIHLLLLVHRYDLAEKEYEAARSWADDSLLIQLIEAQLGVYKGGRNSQQAYYVFDEFASASTSSEEGKGARLAAMKLGRGIGLLKRGDFSRAEESLRETMTLLQQDSDAEAVPPSKTAASANAYLLKEAEANLAVLAIHQNPASKLSNPGQEHLK